MPRGSAGSIHSAVVEPVRAQRLRHRVARKTRTRQHVIADLGCNHVERIALLCGYSVERIQHDYGIDLVIYTYDVNGEAEGGQILVQVKATDALPILADGVTIALPVRHSDLELWLSELMPCILVMYDAQAEVAYWCYIQAHFQSLPDFDLAAVGEHVTVHIPVARLLNPDAMRAFASFRDAMVRQVPGVRHEM